MRRIFVLVLSVLAVLAREDVEARAQTAGNDFGWSAEVDAALTEFEISNTDGAVEQLIPLADAGDVHAQFLLGRFYEDEMEFKVNHCRALHWYKEAAAQGHAAATTAAG